MVRKAPVVVGALAALLLAACHSTPPAASPSATTELELRMAALEQRLAMMERMMPSTSDDGEPLPVDSIERVSRLEARFAKVIGFLRQAVPAQLDESKQYALPIDPLDPVIGPAGAPVTIVEVSEYLCPYCNALEPTMEKLRAAYPTQVRVVNKYMIIHGPDAVPPGAAACAAGRQGKFAAFHRALWATIWPGEGPPDRTAATALALEGLARTQGLDLKRFQADTAAGGACERWVTGSAETLERFGVSGTPTLYVNGRSVGNGRSLEDLKQLVDAELAAVARSGVPAARYYQDVVMAKGEPEAVMISPFD